MQAGVALAVLTAIPHLFYCTYLLYCTVPYSADCTRHTSQTPTNLSARRASESQIPRPAKCQGPEVKGYCTRTVPTCPPYSYSSGSCGRISLTPQRHHIKVKASGRPAVRLNLTPPCNMWTPKKRQRVSRACDLCKRKKKQCTGTQPCATCHSKSAECTFSTQQSQHHQHEQQHPNQHQHLHSHASFPLYKHSDNNASDSTDAPLHRKAPSNTRSDSARPQPLPPKESAIEDVTPIQNRGRLLKDHEGRLGEKYHGYCFCGLYFVDTLQNRQTRDPQLTCYQFIWVTRQPCPSSKPSDDLSKRS